MIGAPTKVAHMDSLNSIPTSIICRAGLRSAESAESGVARTGGDNVKSAEGCCAACNEWNLQHTADFQCNAWTWKAPPDDPSGCGGAQHKNNRTRFHPPGSDSDSFGSCMVSCLPCPARAL